MTSAVVVATYNGEKYVEEQLRSIIEQSIKPNYIVITDDGSEDATLSICHKILKTSGIAFDIIQNTRNKGVANNFFNGISRCQQDVIFFCDQDDVWLSHKVEKMLEYFKNDQKCTMVLSNAYIWDSVTGDIEKDIFNELNIGELVKTKECCEKDIYWKKLIKRNFATGMCMAISKDIAHIQKDDLHIYHDVWYNVLAAAIGNVYLESEPLAYYRQHENNVEGMQKRKLRKIFTLAYKNTMLNIVKELEKIDEILTLQSKQAFLENDDMALVCKRKKFFHERKAYIQNHNLCKLLRMIFQNKNYQEYNSNIFLIRDIIVCLFYRG